MGFINKDQLEKRLDRDVNLVRRIGIEDKGDKGESSGEVPPFDKNQFDNKGIPKPKGLHNSLQSVVATAALITSAKNAAEQFDIPLKTARKLAAGEASNTIDLNQEDANDKLRSEIYESLGTIRRCAQEKLQQVLGLIDENALAAIPDRDKLRTAAAAANQLASVVDKTIEKSAKFDARSAHLHLYTPEQQTSDAYKVVRISKVPLDNTPAGEIIDAEGNG